MLSELETLQSSLSVTLKNLHTIGKFYDALGNINLLMFRIAKLLLLQLNSILSPTVAVRKSLKDLKWRVFTNTLTSPQVVSHRLGILWRKRKFWLYAIEALTSSGLNNWIAEICQENIISTKILPKDWKEEVNIVWLKAIKKKKNLHICIQTRWIWSVKWLPCLTCLTCSCGPWVLEAKLGPVHVSIHGS